VGGVLLFVVYRWVAGRLDRSHIRHELKRGGCCVVDIKWDPISSIFDKSERHYVVTYVTVDNEQIVANCKTSLVTPISWMSDGPPTRFGRGDAEGRAKDRSKPSGLACESCGAPSVFGDRFCSRCGEKIE
jgi:hypothetical protein